MIVPYIRLSTSHPVLRRQEWRPWKKLGYRVLDEVLISFYSGLGRQEWHMKSLIMM
ncbi:MAG: polymerase beta domain protein region [Firmicutes bacterium]|nr:polymerase beta domain protein region [Bacillota bacterium]